MKRRIMVNDEKFWCSPIKDGEGKYAKCYLLTSGETLKVYKKDLFDDECYCVENLLPITGIKNRTYIFPDRLISDRSGKVLGYTANYIRGKNLEVQRQTMTFDKLISGIADVYEDTRELSKKKIYTSNVSSRNIIFNKRFYIIDTDDYFKLDLLSEDSCNSHNILQFNKAIVDYIVKNGMTNYNLISFINQNSYLRKLYQLILREENPETLLSNFLKELQIQISSYADRKINNISEVDKVFVRRR